ncbi:hypothetical protein MMC07_007605 [Pseudocyphellaria aurata]|nr:hypothetical protein [Pseudocyphellaria aurata]
MFGVSGKQGPSPVPIPKPHPLETKTNKNSEDHRGTKESPGRVVTLIEEGYWRDFLRAGDEDREDGDGEDVDEAPQSTSSAPVVWGAAYRIPPQHVESVKTYLDIREINGYTVQYADFYPASTTSSSSSSTASSQTAMNIKQSATIKNTLLYIGLPTNPNFLGALHLREVSAVIASSKGPSGENAEYLFKLEDALKSLGPCSDDKHVKGLSGMVRALLLDKETSNRKNGDDGGRKDHGLRGTIKEGSDDEKTTGDEQAETEKPSNQQIKQAL